MDLVSEIKILINDLRYEPFELLLKKTNLEIIDNFKKEELILKDVRPYQDFKGFIGQCEELAYITAQRIKKKYPRLRVQIWSGRDNEKFRNRESHIFVIIKQSTLFTLANDILVDPSFGVVETTNNSQYRLDRLIFDSKKHNEHKIDLDTILPYNNLTPIYYDKETQKLFGILFEGEEHKKFFIFVDDKFMTDIELIKKHTSNKRFLFFCKKINEYNFKKLDEGYESNSVIIKI